MTVRGGTDAADCLAGGGEMGALMRATDWSRTPYGPVRDWPQSLRTAVSMMLEARFPIVIAWGPEFRFFYNDRYRPILGATKHPMALGTPGREIFPEVWDVVGPEFERVRRGESFAIEDWLLPLDRNGYVENCWFTLSYSPIRDETGGVGGLLAIVADTTGRVEGERRLATLRDLARAASDARAPVAACERAAAVLAANPTDVPFAAIYLAAGGRATLAGSTGVEPGAPAAPLAIDLAGGDRWGLGGALERRAMTVVPDVGARFGALSGGSCPEPAHAAVILPLARPGGGTPYGALIAGVCPRRALDERYRGFFELAAEHVAAALSGAEAYEIERERAEALARLDRAKTQFFSNVSHEFRTPLTLLLGPIEDALAQGSALEGEPLAAAHRSALRLAKLVNSLLEFARIEAGRADASFEPVDLAALTAELAGVFRAAIERAGLRLAVDCPPLPEAVLVDREMWEKIVLNLLSNALKFTFEGEIEVALAWRGDHAELEIRDTGIGIAAEDLPRVFERFQRVAGARARTHEGTGIGLALVRDLCRLHGGDVSVESEPGRGTTFRVRLRAGHAHLPPGSIRHPRALASTAIGAAPFVAEAMRWLPGAGGTSEPGHRSGERVLVADDNADMRDYLARILAERWSVECVADGRAALESARREAPDLILADVMMPELDGFGLLAALRADERTRAIPVVMLSARAGEEARVEGLDAGADDYLVKPFGAKELVARVASQIATARSRRAIERARGEAELQRRHLYALFAEAPAPICVLRGRDLVVELANALCCDAWGRAEAEVLGRPLVDALPELRDQVFPSLLEGVLRTGEPYFGRETPALLGKEGARREVLFDFVYAPMRGLDGAIDAVMVIGHDVTEAVRAREELARTIRFNETFTAVLAHDLRNPLGAIHAGATVLREAGDERTRAIAGRLLGSSDRMARMIDQLLDVARLRLGGGLELRRANSDLRAIAASVTAEVEAPEQPVRIETEGDPCGQWDGDRLAQLLSNLVGNAVQHGERGSPVSVSIDGTAPDHVWVRVENRGPIPESFVPFLFDPFRRAAPRREHARGLGLGLYITREIARAHAGDVTLDPAAAAAGATRFLIRLPRAGGPAERIAAPAHPG